MNKLTFSAMVIALGSLLLFGTYKLESQPSVSPQTSGLTDEQKAILDLFSLVQIDDCNGGPGYTTLRISGANLQIVNGMGNTLTTNGTGNIIVGYNEVANCDNKGSHNVVIGLDNHYTKFGSLAVGLSNEMHGVGSVVFGLGNRSTGLFSNIIGGASNIASGQAASIVGGTKNHASSTHAVVVGGNGNAAHVLDSTTIGGHNNVNMGEKAVVVGGKQNTAFGLSSVLGGGLNRIAQGEFDWVAGALFQTE